MQQENKIKNVDVECRFFRNGKFGEMIFVNDFWYRYKSLMQECLEEEFFKVEQ